jgi:hypothetical protein
MRFHTVLLTLAALVVAGSAPRKALAQNIGSLRGTVTDPSNAVVPGATVVATGNGVSRTVSSDATGKYALPNLPPGKYNIRADAAGFVTYSKADVDVSTGQGSSLDIALQIAAEAQQVSVTDQAAATLSVEASSNVSALVLKDADLDALPDDPDDLQSDLEALAGPAAGPNGAQFFVDGFSGGQLPPKSSIREIRINSNPFSSEYDQPGFGRIEILTRPGTDNYHGQAFINYGDRILDTRNPLITTPLAGYHSLLGTFNIGGPLGKKTSFFIDYNRRAIEQNALVVANVLTPNFAEVPLNSQIFIPNALWQISPRIDYAINQNNTLVIRYNHTQSSNFGGVGGFALPTQETESYIRNNQVQITETSVIGTVAVDETRFQFRDNHNDAVGLGSFATPGINVSSAFNSGGAPYTASDNFSKGYELQNILTTTRGKHALKVGFRARQSDQTTISNSNFNGSYSFLPPSQFSTVPQCPGAVTSLDVYQQTQLMLSEGVPISTILAEGCGPGQFTLSSGIPRIQARQFDLGVFLQDDWRVAPNFTVNAGLRYETQNNIGDHLDLGPRLGVAWAPGAKGKTQSKTVVRAGYGIFFTRFSVGNVLNAIRYDGFTQTNYIITAGSPAALQALSYYALSPGATPALPPTSLLTAENQAIYQIDPALRAPYMGQFAFEVDRQLPGRTQVSINFVNTRGVHQLLERDINAPLTFGPDAYVGPPQGSNVPVVSVRPFSGTGINGANEDIYQYETAGIFKQTQLTINANSRVNSHIQLQGYYTYGQAHTNASGFPMNQYNLNEDYGRASFDIRNRGYFGGGIGLPFKINLNPFMTVQSGAPFDITTGQAFDGDGILNSRPYFAPCATAQFKTRYGCFSPTGTQLIPVNYGDGPSQVNLNLRISRTWGWGERAGSTNNPNGGGGFNPGGGPPGGFQGGGGGGGRGGGGFGGGGGGGRGGRGGGGFGNVNGNTGKRYNLTLNVEARNALNHVNYAAPTGVLGSPFFGISTALNNGGGGGFGGNNGSAGNRKVQVQLRFQF